MGGLARARAPDPQVGLPLPGRERRESGRQTPQVEDGLPPVERGRRRGAPEDLHRVGEAVCFDHLNVTEMASFELLGGSLQILDEKYRDRLAGSSDPSRVDTHLYLGTELARGNCCVCPALQDWMSQELAKEHAILKERRKAREERAAAATAKAKAKARGGQGGADDA